MVEAFIGGLAISAVIGSLLGNTLKDRPGAGAVLGLLLGPIGWLAVFFLEDNQRLCPKCKDRVPADATICRHCRSQLPPPPPPPKIGVLPKALRALGIVGFIVTVIAALVYNSQPQATDDGMLRVGALGFIPSALLFGIGYFMSHVQHRKQRT